LFITPALKSQYTRPFKFQARTKYFISFEWTNKNDCKHSY